MPRAPPHRCAQDLSAGPRLRAFALLWDLCSLTGPCSRSPGTSPVCSHAPLRIWSRHPPRGPSQRPQAGYLYHTLWALPPPWAPVAGINVSWLRTHCAATDGHAFLCRADKRCSGIPISPDTSSPPAMMGAQAAQLPHPGSRSLMCVFYTDSWGSSRN